MPRRRKLPPGYPTQPYVPRRVPKHECEYCGGFTKPVKGQLLDEAVVNHLATCPAVHRVINRYNPRKKE